MLSAGRRAQQARHIWIALGCYGHADTALSCGRDLTFLASGAATGAWKGCGVAPSGIGADLPVSHAASDSGRSESASCMFPWPHASPLARGAGSRAGGPPSASLPALPSPAAAPGLRAALRADALSGLLGPGAPAGGALGCTVAAAASLQLGRRSYHPWYYGSKLRNRAILSISSLDQLAEMLRQNGDKLDHINLTVFLRQLQLVAYHVAAKATTPAGPTVSTVAAADGASAAAPGSAAAAVATAVAAASSRAVEQQVQLLAAEAMRLVRKRCKWYDPRNAASVVYCTASLGYTDGRVLDELTGRTMARLNEAYSRDLLLLLRGLDRHAKLSARATASASTLALAATAGDTAAASAGHAAGLQGEPRAEGQLDAGTLRPAKPANHWWQRVRRPQRYGGPPEGLLEGVERFLVAKIPTGRMPPENVDGLLRFLRELLPPGRPLSRELLAMAEGDLRRRLAIYAPEPLAGVLDSLAAERHPLSLDLLDTVATHFAMHASKYGTGHAAARFLAAAAALLRDCWGSGRGNGGEGAPISSVFPSFGEWITSRPELLVQCLRLMSKDLPTANVDCLVAWMMTLNSAGVPLASLAPGTTPGVAAPVVDPPHPAMATARMAATAGSLPSSATASATAAMAAAVAAFVRAHGAAVEIAVARLPQEGITQLRKSYDTAGLPYPRGL